MSVLVMLKPESQWTDYNARLLGAAQQWDSAITVFMPGPLTDECQQGLMNISQLNHITALKEPLVAGCVASQYLAQQVIAMIKEHRISKVLMGDDFLAKTVLPQVAVRLHSGQVSGVIAIQPSGQLVQSVYTSNVCQTVTLLDDCPCVSCHPVSFAVASEQSEHSISMETVMLTGLDSHCYGHCVDVDTVMNTDDISSAKRIIGIGRGIQDPGVYEGIVQFASQYGFAVGGTREAILAQRIGYERQIGQSGKSIAPDVYLALGLSGAKHHLAGVRQAKTIIAVNTDPDAPIMQVADYALVGDVADVLPELIAVFAASVAG